MPHERPIRMTVAVPVDSVVEQPPEERRLGHDLARPLRLFTDLGLIRPHHLGHAPVLDEGREAVLPAEPLQARREGGRVADQDHDVHPEAIGEPLCRQQGDRVLHERPSPRPPPTTETSVVARDANEVAPAPRRLHLGPNVVPELERTLETVAIAALVRGRDHREVAVEACRAEPFRRLRAEGLVDVGDAGREREHLPYPGCARAVRAGDEDRLVAHREFSCGADTGARLENGKAPRQRGFPVAGL